MQSIAATLAAVILAVAAPPHRHHRPMARATASIYADGGNTACGFHASHGLGFAHLGPGETAEGWTPALGGLRCGQGVRICARRCVRAIMDDHGPYIFGREFDLSETLRSAIGASDLGSVRYRLLR